MDMHDALPSASSVPPRHERLYIGALQDLNVTAGKIPEKLNLDETFTFTLTPADENEIPSGGSIIFRNGNVSRSVPVKSIAKAGRVWRITAAAQFLFPGKYEVALRLNRSRFNGKTDLFLGQVQVSGDVRLPDFEVVRKDGKA